MKQFDLRSYTEQEMICLAEQYGEKPFRGKQLFEWIHGRQVPDFAGISNLPRKFLENLARQHKISGVQIRKNRFPGIRIPPNISFHCQMEIWWRVYG